MRDFNPTEIISLCGSSLTLQNLEYIIGMINQHGRVAIIEVGPTSLLDLAMDLLAYAKEREANHASL